MCLLCLCNYFFLYSYLETNLFLSPYYGLHNPVVDDYSSGKKYGISGNIYDSGVKFGQSLNITIKELEIYTFKKGETFKKISNDIFNLVHKHVFRGIEYYLEVMRIDIY